MGKDKRNCCVFTGPELAFYLLYNLELFILAFAFEPCGERDASGLKGSRRDFLIESWEDNLANLVTLWIVCKLS